MQHYHLPRSSFYSLFHPFPATLLLFLPPPPTPFSTLFILLPLSLFFFHLSYLFLFHAVHPLFSLPILVSHLIFLFFTIQRSIIALCPSVRVLRTCRGIRSAHVKFLHVVYFLYRPHFRFASSSGLSYGLHITRPFLPLLVSPSCIRAATNAT